MGEDAFELFTTDFSDSSIEVVVHAANKLTVVAAAIGKDDVNAKLIPYLPKLIDYPSDEVLTAIAQQLYNVFDIAGGASIPPSSLNCILAALQQLAEEEELIVRQSAVKSFNRIIPHLSSDDLINKVYPIYKTLALNEWFAPRNSAAGFAAALVKYIPDSHRQLIISSFRAFLSDETPMVKRIAALNFPSFIQSLFSVETELNMVEVVRMQLLFFIQQLALEERDYIRELSSNIISVLITYLTLDDYIKYLYPLIVGLGDDHSWKVRQQLTLSCPAILTSLIRKAESIYQGNDPYKLGDTTTKEQLSQPDHPHNIRNLLLQVFKVYMDLLNDCNLEVRSIAILIVANIYYVIHGILDVPLRKQKLTADITIDDNLDLDQQFSVGLSPQEALEDVNPKPQYTASPSITALPLLDDNDKNKAVDDILTQLAKFAVENSTLSKLDICEQIAELSIYLGSEKTRTSVLPIALELAQSQSVEVKSTAFLTLRPIIEMLPFEDIENQIIPAIDAAQKDLRWRVRRSVVTQYAVIARATKQHTQFHKDILFPLIKTSLLENVHTIRNRTAVEFRALTAILGYDVITTSFSDCFIQLFDPNINYIHRLTALHLAYFITTSPGETPPRSTILADYGDIFTQSLADQVPNVRILALRYIAKLFKLFDLTFFETKILPDIYPLEQSPDKEVAFQARAVLALYNSR